MNRKFANLDADNKIVYAPDGVVYEGRYHTRPTEVMYRANGFYPLVEETPDKVGVTFTATAYGDIVDGVIRRRYDETPLVPPAPPVTRYSGWKMYKAIKAEGFGEAFDALMKADIGVMIAFVRPQYFLSNDEDFVEMVTQMCAALHIDDAAKERILAASVDEEVA